MNSFRVARSALRVSRTALQKRAYADVAPDKIRLSLALPHQVRTIQLLEKEERRKADRWQ